MNRRLDEVMVKQGLVQSRSQAQRLIKMGKVLVGKKQATKPHQLVFEPNSIEIKDNEKYVSRAGFKLASVVKALGLNFKDKIVLDVGSSTGGFTDYALQHGSTKIIAVDVGTEQLHRSLRGNPRIELHEKTDIRHLKGPLEDVNIVVIDVSFISLREILPSVAKLVTKPEVQIVAMVKPQFEAGSRGKNKGVIKNDTVRRQILKDFEQWSKKLFVIVDKADSDIEGGKGNRERFYLLKKI